MHDRIFAAGGEHIPSTWRDFARQTGVTAVLHMRSDSPAVFHGPPPEILLWLDVENESQIGFTERLVAGRFLAEMVAENRRILLHSSLGRHRTRWAFVAFCIQTGQSARAALRRAADRPWLSPYHTDENAWHDFSEVLRAAEKSSPSPSRRS